MREIFVLTHNSPDISIQGWTFYKITRYFTPIKFKTSVFCSKMARVFQNPLKEQNLSQMKYRAMMRVCSIQKCINFDNYWSRCRKCVIDALTCRILSWPQWKRCTMKTMKVLLYLKYADMQRYSYLLVKMYKWCSWCTCCWMVCWPQWKVATMTTVEVLQLGM